MLPPQPPAQADDQPELTKLAVECHCNVHHGENFAGHKAAARLAGQREEVLLKAPRDDKAGMRMGTGVAAMPEIAFSLSEDEMKAVSHYLARQP